MKTPLYKLYENAEPIGLHTLCNFGGLAILAIDDYYDIAVAAFHFGDGYQQIRQHKIQYSPSGRPFIRKQGTRYYFDEIIRTGAGA